MTAHSFIQAISIAPLQVLYYSCRSAPDTSRIGYCVGVSRLSATYTVPNCFNSQTPQTLHSKALLQFFSS